jgi:hypothetical protein
VQEAEREKLAASVSAARQQAHGSGRFNERIRTFHYVVRPWPVRAGARKAARMVYWKLRLRRGARGARGSAWPAHGRVPAPAPLPPARHPAAQDGRVTDHRVPGLSIMGGVERVLSGGELATLIDAVAAARREEALAELLERPEGDEEEAAPGRRAAGG